MLHSDKQHRVGGAEEAAFRTIESLISLDFPLPKTGREKTPHHFEIALGVTPPLRLWRHYPFAWSISHGDGFEDSNDHVELAKSHVAGLSEGKNDRSKDLENHARAYPMPQPGKPGCTDHERTALR